MTTRSRSKLNNEHLEFQVLRWLTGIGRTRLLTHAGLALTTLAAIYAATRYIPTASWQYVLTIGCGYLSLALIILTLSIGTFKLLTQRRVPVNLYIRRDIGIWAGITGIIHVIFGLTVHFNGDIIPYFLRVDPLQLRLDRFGLSNDIGAAATITLVLLLVSSNDYSLKLLKGKRWKTLQRLNYLLAGLVIIHTLVYQDISRREPPFRSATMLLILILMVAQTAGFMIYRARQAKPAMRRMHAAESPPESVSS